MKNIFTSLFAAIILLLSGKSFAQVTITSSDSITCTNLCTTLTANVIGDTPTIAGITTDDFFNSIPNPIGFTFIFYGIPYTQCLIGPNGNVDFNISLAGAHTAWEILGPLLGNATVFNTICGPWCDILEPAGGSIAYSTDGVAPNRKFVVTYCHDAMFSCTTQYTTSQIIMYETTNIVEVHLAHKDICTNWNPGPDTPPDGGRAIIGVQNATGTSATVAPGRDWIPVWSATNEAWRFTPNATGSSYAVSSILYAPIPFESSSVYWYNASTGAYISTGTSITVCPTSTTTYKAAALGCSDTSFA